MKGWLLMTTKTTFIRVLLLREGRAAKVVNVEATNASFAAVVGGEPLMLLVNDTISVVTARDRPKAARSNIRAIEAGDPACGHIAGTVFVVQHGTRGDLVSIDDAHLPFIRGYFEGRRVGAC